MASRKQISFIEGLLIDADINDRKQRNAYLTAELGREIHYVDDLTTEEASRIIDDLKRLKDYRWEERAKSSNRED